jgi:uncharacterized Zn finger protein (UPF0148 family)
MMDIDIKPCIYCYKKHCFVLGPGDKKKTYQVYCPICESLGPWKATKTEAVEAHNQVAGLREENERLRVESQSASDSAFYHKSISDGLQDKLAALREENERLKEELKVTRHYLKHHQENSDRLINEVERLRANAIVWHKWPEEKPDDYESRNLVYWDNKDDLPCEANPPGYWFEEDSFHWAEIPKPEDR